MDFIAEDSVCQSPHTYTHTKKAFINVLSISFLNEAAEVHCSS